MFNTIPFKILKTFRFILLLSVVFSCEKKSSLQFSEIQILEEGETIIEINIPKAKGQSDTATHINTALSQFIHTALNIEGTYTTTSNISESITRFKTSYSNFKKQIGQTFYTQLPSWEVLIDGEVLYKSEALISIAMTSSINTGGAHSTLVFQFYNFDVKTGKQLTTKNLINDVEAFTVLAKKHYHQAILSAEVSSISVFESEVFEIPENIGYSEDGVIVLYDTFNSGSQHVIEFTIPYTEAAPYLNF